jgi:hypothetical protein
MKWSVTIGKRNVIQLHGRGVTVSRPTIPPKGVTIAVISMRVKMEGMTRDEWPS